MKTNVSNEQFMKWVEQYLNDTIQPEAAQQLLHTLQNDPERLEQFCGQLQTDQWLKPESTESVFDAVLKRIESKATPKIIRPARWSRIMLRAAAVFAVILGIQLLVPDRTGKEPDTAFEPPTGAMRPASAEEPAGSTENRKIVRLKKTRIPKPQLDGEGTRLRKQIVAKPQPMPAPKPNTDQILTDRVSGVLSSMGGTVPALELASMGRSPSVVENNTEAYATIEENEWFSPSEKPLSTFSIDVDTASYANVRRFLNNGQRPPKDAVRIEEMINYFEYDYTAPKGDAPFSTAMDVHTCPWNPAHKLLRVGLQGRRMDEGANKPSNLVFLLDVSGSMNSPDKLPLLKKGFTMLVNALGKNDRVAIVAYAGASGLVLDSTSADNNETIIQAMDRLSAGGSTAGGAGIELAYRVAADHYIPGGINRVILATDGDFNVGISSQSDLQKLIEAKRETGVFLSVLGFGTGNLKDSTMELLANKGNGNYFYIDSEREADKVLVKQLTANMITIAKDVKIQIEFNPAVIRSYRLIGYENRVMAAQDFADDRKDAGEIGAGHQVTALYELVTTDAPATQDGVALKYAQPIQKTYADSDEMLTLKLRYKAPEGTTSKLLSFPLKADTSKSTDSSFRWAAAVAAFGQYLRESEPLTRYSLEEIQELAESAVGRDPSGYRREFIQLIQQARKLEGQPSTGSDYPQWQYRR